MPQLRGPGRGPQLLQSCSPEAAGALAPVETDAVAMDSTVGWHLLAAAAAAGMRRGLSGQQSPPPS